jgi:hypothetical protein
MNIKCFETMYTGKSYITYRVLFLDGSEIRYRRKIPFYLYLMFDIDTLVSYYHVLGCTDYSS